MLDMISIGDPTIDTILDITDATVQCNVNREDCMLCLDYAEKLPVRSLYLKIAGNSCNNAVASARLGMDTAYYMIVGNDDLGQGIASFLKKEKVHDDYFLIDKKHPTNASTVIGFKDDRTILVYHAPRVYTLPKLKPSRWLYYSSVNAHHLNLNTSLIRHAKKTGAKLCYNPGTFQRLTGAKEMQRVARACEMVFVNKEEAEDLTETHATDVPKLLKLMVKIGMQVAVITDGDRGSYVYDGDRMYHMGVYNTPIIEKTGAGDAFASTLIAMLHDGHPIPEAMCLAAGNSASVITKQGPQDGLLKKPELIKFHKRNKHTHAKQIA